jgi:RNA polymerase sigma factor (sigma-70 family)
MFNFFEQLLDLEPNLFKYASHLNLHREDAQDLVQETFLKAILNRDKFVDTKYLKAWTMTIMKNTFINNYRRNITRKSHYGLSDEAPLFNKSEYSVANDPDSIYAIKEIKKSIEQLKEKFRIPFKMYIDGFKYREIASAINLKVGTVKSRIFLARRLLRNHLSA